MGVMNADNPAVMSAAYDLGIRLFDTAWRYQNGRNEEMVGRVIREKGIRDKITLATKVPLAMGNRSSYTLEELEDVKKDDPNWEKTLHDDYLATFEESLQRLQLKHVDILYVHSVKDPGTIELPFLLDALEKIKKDGKATYLGVSTHRREEEIINKVTDMKTWDVVLAPLNYKSTRREGIKKALQRAAGAGVGVVAMKTQAVYSSSAETNHTAALKYALKHEFVATSIPGFTTFEHLEQDFSVARNLEYTEEEKKYLDNYWESFEQSKSSPDRPCDMCEKCIGTCPNNADIPDLVRTYRYAAGYGNLEHARITYDGIPKNQNLSQCSKCDSCVATCVNGRNLASNINHLKALFARA
jgi:predicted aldo/keto reductase-like oxidoreductase